MRRHVCFWSRQHRLFYICWCCIYYILRVIGIEFQKHNSLFVIQCYFLLTFCNQLIFKLGRFNSDVSCEIKVKPLLHISSSFLFVASRFNQPIVFAMKQYTSVTKVLTLSYCHIQIMSRIMIMGQKGVKPNFCTNCSISLMFVSKFC